MATNTMKPLNVPTVSLKNFPGVVLTPRKAFEWNMLTFSSKVNYTCGCGETYKRVNYATYTTAKYLCHACLKCHTLNFFVDNGHFLQAN